MGGYGLVHFVFAHRLMCELAHGKPPTRKHRAAHSCWVPHCVNPRHLSWKTNSEIQRERYRRRPKDRHRGQRRKLTAEQVAKIRALEPSHTQRELSGIFGVRQCTINVILRRKTWITGELRLFGGRGEGPITQQERLERARFYLPHIAAAEFVNGEARSIGR
jgi:HNH endonuclease